MEPQTQNREMPNQNPVSQAPQMPAQNKSSIGSIIGTIIIIAIIILGGLYFWGKRVEEMRANQDLVKDDTAGLSLEENEAAVIRAVNSGDDFDSIQGDLNNTKLDNLSGEINAQ